MYKGNTRQCTLEIWGQYGSVVHWQQESVASLFILINLWKWSDNTFRHSSLSTTQLSNQTKSKKHVLFCHSTNLKLSRLPQVTMGEKGTDVELRDFSEQSLPIPELKVTGPEARHLNTVEIIKSDLHYIRVWKKICKNPSGQVKQENLSCNTKIIWYLRLYVGISQCKRDFTTSRVGRDWWTSHMAEWWIIHRRTWNLRC